ncbi:MAG: hypothetical protein LBN39_01560 [Planctomycetaceae bacterium]|nr:hypothetical protein [Planctomycetaceae bacterium]
MILVKLAAVVLFEMVSNFGFRRKMKNYFSWRKIYGGGESKTRLHAR